MSDMESRGVQSGRDIGIGSDRLQFTVSREPLTFQAAVWSVAAWSDEIRNARLPRLHQSGLRRITTNHKMGSCNRTCRAYCHSRRYGFAARKNGRVPIHIRFSFSAVVDDCKSASKASFGKMTFPNRRPGAHCAIEPQIGSRDRSRQGR